MERIDLHTHSTFSDGVLSPRQLLVKARDEGLAGLVVTDHDNIQSCEIAIEEADKLGLKTMSGCEISSFYGGKEYHLLAYGFGYKNQELIEKLDFIQEQRILRADNICHELKKLGINVNIDDVLKKAGTSSVTRPHIAKVIVEKGFATTTREAFNNYIGDNGPAQIQKFNYPMEDAIKLVHKAGGITVLAHPDKKLSRMGFYNFIKIGLDGIETVHPYVSDNRAKFLTSIASQYQLITTGGSDYHGINEWEEYTFGTKYVQAEILTRINKKIRSIQERNKF